MSVRTVRSISAASLALLVVLPLTPLASAAHYFLPNGISCFDGTVAAPGGSYGATVQVGNPYFRDTTTGTALSVIKAGQSVRFTWIVPHCHSITHGGPAAGLPAGQFNTGLRGSTESLAIDEVVTPSGAGVFNYFCIHHPGRQDVNNAGLGMRGVIVVTA